MKLWHKLTHLHKDKHIPIWALILLLLFFGVYALGQIGRVEIGPAVFYSHDIVIALWLICASKRIIKHLHTVHWQRHVVWIVVGTWISGSVLLATSISQDFTPVFYLVRLVTYSFFVYSVALIYAADKQFLRILLAVTGVCLMVSGLLMYSLMPDTRAFATLNWDDHYYRLVGALLDPNFSGMWFIIFGWTIVSIRSVIPKQLMWVGIALVVVTLVLTYSRATYLAAIISALWWIWVTSSRQVTRRFPLIILSLVISAVLIFWLAPKPGGEGVNLLRTYSIASRIESSTEYLQALEPYQWIIGAGLYTKLPNISEFSHAQVPDNLIVLIIYSAGIGGLLLFFTVFTLYYRTIKSWQVETQAMLVALAIHAQFNNTLLEPFIFLAVGLMLISQTPKDYKLPQ